jgi:hypothetical protein
LLAAAALTRTTWTVVAAWANLLTTAALSRAAWSRVAAGSDSFAAATGTDLLTGATGAWAGVAGQIADVRTRAFAATAGKSAGVFMQELRGRATRQCAARNCAGAGDRAATGALDSTTACAWSYSAAG